MMKNSNQPTNNRNTRRITYNKSYYNSYNNSSEAFEYAPNYEPKYNPSIKKKKRKKLKDKYINAEQKESYLSPRFFVTLTIISAIAICIVNMNAKIIQKRFELDNLTSQLKEIKANNKNLGIEIDKNLDLEYIQEYATTYLKMQKPSSHQIVYINVPKESYTVKTEGVSQDKKQGFSLFNFFNSLFRVEE